MPGTTLVLSPGSLNTRSSDKISVQVHSGEPGITKYTVDIFCQRKADGNGNRREELPRDVREFRLAKLALIPIVAGARKFVSIDVVFGDIDKQYAAMVEKHFAGMAYPLHTHPRRLYSESC
jgi:hypothetical protein